MLFKTYSDGKTNVLKTSMANAGCCESSGSLMKPPGAPDRKSVPFRMVLYHFSRYLLGLVSTYVCTYHRREEFIIALIG